MAFINKLLGKDEREENLKQEIRSMELRKESIVAAINGEIANMQAEQRRILLEAGQHAYGIWCRENVQSDLTNYFEQTRVLDDKIAQEELRKKEMAARYDEEIQLIAGNINVAVGNPNNFGGTTSGCPNCGFAVKSGDLFCQGCGSKLG